MIARFLVRVAIAAFAAIAAISVASAEEDSILILDASGSMWGQINKEAKITIAKRVMGDVIAKTPASRRLGLIAYGHRREGDCADIEEVAPVGADRAAITATVGKLNAKGKTPMTDSVKLAAEKLQYTKNKATIILVSDGIETCAPDPCAAAAALEAAGADLTVHVVGFDVAEENAKAQLACIAENTGGQFISASNASELNQALQTTVVQAPPAPAANLYLRATELAGGMVIDKGLTWSVKASAGGAAVVSQANAGEVDASVQPGTYDVDVVRASDGLKGSAKGVVIQQNAQKTVTIALEFPVAATVAVEPANTGVAGTDIKVKWTGPDRKGDFIAIAKKDEPAGAYESYQYVRLGDPASLRLPVDTGTYEIRYVLGAPYRVLAKTDYAVTEATATLTAPDAAVAGSELAVDFTGPPANSSDYVTITKPGAADTEYTAYAYSRNGSPAKIRAPLEPGDYELRFVQAGRKVLARKKITITAAEATVSAPATAKAGESVKVAFTGPPAGSGDWITVIKADAPASAYADYAYTKQGSPADIRMPLEAGDYEVRYVQGGNKVIARQNITVIASEATVTAKVSAVAGETVTVEFTGPEAGSGDFITVTTPDADARAYTDYAYTKQGSPASIRMPLEAGTYEIRFVQSNTKVLAKRAIAVAAAAATLSAPDSAKAGSTIAVAFTGPPAGSGDYVTITEVGAPDAKYMDYAYSKAGSPAQIKMPTAPGDYEIRFVHGNKYVLARRPIKVTP